MPKSVLIVDDSLVSRMMISEIISSRHRDWKIVLATSGDDAIDKSAGESFDLITLDLNMPGKDGLEVAPRLIELHPQAKIALMTANIQTAVREKADALGLSFVAKPIREDSVLGFIEA